MNTKSRGNETATNSQADKHSAKLQVKRKPIGKMIMEDCVTLGLVSPKRAKQLVQQMPGKDPKDAETEVVTELRNNLYEQIRKFMRKHKGGPWTSPTEQNDIRLEITNTPNIRMLVSLTRQLLREQNGWLDKNKTGLASRLFGMARKK